jgi:NarL family two-component system response regulator LiaR
MEKICILIADDHALVRDGIRRILDAEDDMEVIGEASDGEEAVHLAVELNPNVVLMDIVMPKVDGIAATEQIKRECPEINVLILSAYDDDRFVLRLLQSGASGYLLKSIQSQELLAGIRAVHLGESVLHPTIARKVLQRYVLTSEKPMDTGRTGGLTPREIEFLKLMTRGLSNKEIADEVNLSIRTVQGCVGQIFKKLGVNSRTEAVIYAVKEGWVTLEEVPTLVHPVPATSLPSRRPRRSSIPTTLSS